jgi:hypothetical protein
VRRPVFARIWRAAPFVRFSNVPSAAAIGNADTGITSFANFILQK